MGDQTTPDITEADLIRIAGSIAKPFEERKRRLSSFKWVWFVALIASVGIFVWAAFYTAKPFTMLANVSEADKTISAPNQQINKSNDRPSAGMKSELSEMVTHGGSAIVALIILRISMLTPTVIFMIFCIAQYNKERELEEHYAHREAVSRSMPAYFELFEQSNLADDTARVAGDIVFQSPVFGKTESIEKGALKLFEKMLQTYRDEGRK